MPPTFGLQVIDKALEANQKPDVQDFGAKADDPEFLNALQKTMARWIREIQKVRCAGCALRALRVARATLLDASVACAWRGRQLSRSFPPLPR